MYVHFINVLLTNDSFFNLYFKHLRADKMVEPSVYRLVEELAAAAGSEFDQSVAGDQRTASNDIDGTRPKTRLAPSDSGRKKGRSTSANDSLFMGCEDMDDMSMRGENNFDMSRGNVRNGRYMPAQNNFHRHRFDEDYMGEGSH